MIHSFEYCIKKREGVGIVESSKEFLVKARGLPHVVIGEGVTFENEIHGRVIAYDNDHVEILVLSKSPIPPDTKVASTGSPLLISTGNGVLGHTLNSLGHPLNSRKQKSVNPENREIEVKPDGIVNRHRISRFFETGVSIIDTVIPIGAGQRELVIGDRKTGKTQFLLQTLLTQARKGTICIYCAIGKRKSEIKSIEEYLTKQNIMDTSVIIAADSHSSPGEIFIAPYSAMAIAEFFRDQGKDVLIIMDDLTTHAKYYREISLLNRQFPGRESYPGDIFHIHSKILERAGCYIINGKEVAITCLPVAESVVGDITGYIQTNLMSMTDGHIFFDSEIFTKGRRPAINIFLSVTRVGKQTQSPLLREMGNKIILMMKEYEVAQRFLRFGPELSEQIRSTLAKGDSLLNLFNQTETNLIPINLQITLIGLVWLGLWDGKDSFVAVESYKKNTTVRNNIESFIKTSITFEDLIVKIKKESKTLLKLISK